MNPNTACAASFIVSAVGAFVSTFVAVGAGDAEAQDCSKQPLGQLPIDDLHAGEYLGVEGGLYPGRINRTPDGHLKAGRHRSKKIVPLGPDGEPADDGVIAVASIGMSLTNQVFDWFMNAASSDPEVAAEVTFARCGAPWEDLERMRDPQSHFWTEYVPAELELRHLTAEQIQVVWLLEGTAFQELPFPDHVTATADAWVDVLHLLQQTFPNLKLAFLSPLFWHGYSDGSPEDEPYYFEQGFSVREVIGRQLAGDPELAWDPEFDVPVAPWVDWGPYFWSDGLEPRTDGLAIECTDIRTDGVHLTESGKKKLGSRLLQFIKSHRACTRWSVVAGTTPSERMADVERIGGGTQGFRGEPRLCGGSLPTIPHVDPYRLLARQCLRRGSGFVLLGDSLLPEDGSPFAGGRLYVDADNVLGIDFDTAGNGVLALDEIPDDPALIGVSYFAQLAAIDPRVAEGFALSAAIELLLGD